MTNLLQTKLATSPALARLVPFVNFLGLTLGQGQFGEGSRYWIYLAKTIVGAWLIWSVWPLVDEMRWKFSWEAVAAGVAVFAIWVGLDGFYPSLDQIVQGYVCPVLKSIGLEFLCPEPTPLHPWNPYVQFGHNSVFASLFIVARIAGSSLIVPPLEEVFYRSFLYRWIAKPDFQSVSLSYFHWKPFLVTAIVFGFSHREWMAAILCAFAYQGLVCWKKRLGDAIVAHATTNFLLGVWVVWKGAWNFW